MKKSSILLLSVLTAIIFVASCERPIESDGGHTSPYPGQSGVSSTGPTPPENPIELSGAVIACEETADCVKVDIGCDEGCARWVAVNEGYKVTVKERNSYTCPENYSESCDQSPVVASCEEGKCALVEATAPLNLCNSDDDCVIVELGCCDHCNGGRVYAANKYYKDAAKEEMGDDCSDNPPCTAMGCAPKLARCTDGTCEAYDDPSYLQ